MVGNAVAYNYLLDHCDIVGLNIVVVALNNFAWEALMGCKSDTSNG